MVLHLRCLVIIVGATSADKPGPAERVASGTTSKPNREKHSPKGKKKEAVSQGDSLFCCVWITVINRLQTGSLPHFWL